MDNRPPRQRRKPNRLNGFDYSSAGAYFVTICSEDRKNLFSEIPVGAATCRPKLTPTGELVDDAIKQIPQIYPNVSVDCYVIMPNHVHMLIFIQGRQVAAPTELSRIVGNMKRIVSKRAGFSPWQKSFYDHIIRDEHDYTNHAEYIENNPLKWELDKYYS